MATINKIREIRKKRGLTQEKLAEYTGKAKSQISKIETGSMRLNTNWIDILSSALQCNPSDIIGDRESNNLLDRDLFKFARNKAMQALLANIDIKLSAEDEDMFIFDVFCHAIKEIKTEGEASVTLATAELILQRFI